MKDDEFFELQLRTLFPTAGNWSDTYAHQKALLAAVNEGTTLVRTAHQKLGEISANRDLTPEAKKRMRLEVAKEFLNKLENSSTLTKTREAAAQVLEKYKNQIEAPLQLQEDARQVSVHSQIRDRLTNMKDQKEQLKFLEKHGSDPAVQRAVLTAPAWLSGLSDGTYALVRSQMEKQAPPEILAERNHVAEAWLRSSAVTVPLVHASPKRVVSSRCWEWPEPTKPHDRRKSKHDKCNTELVKLTGFD